MALSNAAAGFIGASVTLVLVIIFMILMVILIRQCLAFVSKRNAIRAQVEHQIQVREQIRQRRGSVTEPIPATFDWHHSIRIAGTPPPSYVEAKKLPTLEDDHRSNSKEPLSVDSKAPPDDADQKKMEANGVHSSPSRPPVEEVVVEVGEGRGGGGGGGGETVQNQTRTFTTDYTEFGTAT